MPLSGQQCEMGMDIKMSFKFNSNNTFEETTTVAGETIDQTTGTWTATTDVVTVTPTACKSANEDTGVLETTDGESADTMPINISGNTWTIDIDGDTIELKKQ